MQRDDETTGTEQVSTVNRGEVSVSTTIALKGQRLLGWTRCGTAYCQLIRAPSRTKRLEWARQNLGGAATSELMKYVRAYGNQNMYTHDWIPLSWSTVCE